MGKHSRDESAGDGAAPSRKRVKNVSTALSSLLEHADELIDCLRNLKAEHTLDDDGQKFSKTSKERLASLSTKLLPAFQALGDRPEEPQQENKSPAQNLSNAGLQAPPFDFITKWTLEEVKDPSPPPLPAVLDPKLHASWKTHTGAAAKTGISYERLEWIGDAYLELIATALIFQTFPSLPEGRLSQHRELLVRNSTLSMFTRQYGLDKQANLPEEFRPEGRIGGGKASDKQRIKVEGGLFEAFVGAVILSHPKGGVRRAADWLKRLWGPIVLKDIKGEEDRSSKGKESNPKDELERQIGGRGIKLEYRDLPSNKKHRDHNLALYTVGLFLTGWGETEKQLGWGSALSKKEAGQSAARMALANKKLIKPYQEKKQVYMAAREAALRKQ